MDSVSRPLLIALGGVVVLLLVWLVALKPGPVPVDTTPLGPTQAIPKAQQAAAASDAANAKVQAATGEPAATATTAAPATSAPAPATSAAAPATATPAAPAKPAAAASSTRDGPILRDIRAGRVVVVLFWNPQAADDIATRGALRGLDRHHGKVAVHVVPVDRVGRYPAITRGVTIAQSPTTLVIDRKRHTRVIAGLSEPRELAQAVDDALAGR
jgi:nucleoid-associated protein YgaU